MPMRLLLIIGLLATVGCASAPTPGSTPGSMEWDTVLAQPDGAPKPFVKDGQLVLAGGAVRSRTTYTPSFTMECELASAQASSNASFYIDFVPQDASTAVLPQEYVGIKLNNGTLEAWASTSNHPARLIKSTAVHVSAEGRYKLAMEVLRDGFTVAVNSVPMMIDVPVPYDKFRIELRSSPPVSQWVVSNFTIH
jgi:hypothetical protein